MNSLSLKGRSSTRRNQTKEIASPDFDDTLIGDIRVGRPDADEQDVLEAARLAGVDEIVARFAGAAERMAEVFAGSPAVLASLPGLAAHGWRGPAREVRLQTRPWGFVPGEVAQPVRLWHAPADQEVPFPAAEATAALFPAARLTEQGAPDHIPSEETLGELFAELRAASL
ncbi:hypothetical protein [Streptomyces cyaneofuscatus]|uniref:alpha/beta fold hydrolase n=1 Tax=Streptomyces cyaneofuscatus TaxID=66883 RepID=UPI00365E22DE